MRIEYTFKHGLNMNAIKNLLLILLLLFSGKQGAIAQIIPEFYINKKNLCIPESPIKMGVIKKAEEAKSEELGENPPTADEMECDTEKEAKNAAGSSHRMKLFYTYPECR